MIPREILKKIRQIELRTTGSSAETSAASIIASSRAGDEFRGSPRIPAGRRSRAIDWNVTGAHERIGRENSSRNAN